MQNFEVGEIAPTSALGQVATPLTCPNLDPSFACPRCADAKAGDRESEYFAGTACGVPGYARLGMVDKNDGSEWRELGCWDGW